MSQKQAAMVRSLKRQHHLLWLLLGMGFSVWLVFQLDQGGLISLLILLGLLAIYYAAGQLVAHMIAHSILHREEAKQSRALMSGTLKFGGYASMLSIMFHLVLLGIAGGRDALNIAPQVQVSILVRAAIFPFLACLGAALTTTDSAGTESTGMVQYPNSSGLPTPTD